MPKRMCFGPDSATTPAHGEEHARRVDIELLQLVDRAVGRAVLEARVAESARDAARQHRQRAAAMRHDPFDVGIFRERAAEQQVCDGAHRIEREFLDRRDDIWEHLAAALRLRRMDEGHRLAAVELGQHRRESGIAEILPRIGGREAHAVAFERVEHIGDLGERLVDFRQRHHAEAAEAAGMIDRELCQPFVARAYHAAEIAGQAAVQIGA